jgi:predicted nucleic acid-binding protein
MAIFYLDTSALLKRYRTEKGSDIVDEIYDNFSSRDVIITSYFSCIEFEAVAARALKGRVLTKAAYDAMLGSFSADLANYVTLSEVTSPLVSKAIDYARTFALRAPDSVQLASALEACGIPDKGPFALVTSDAEILDAALSAPLRTLDPESPSARDLLDKLRRV